MKIGLIAVGLNTYWNQFGGLRERLDGYRNAIKEKMEAYGGQIIADPCEAGHPHSITEICSLQACGKPSAPARGRCGDIVGNEP